LPEKREKRLGPAPERPDPGGFNPRAVIPFGVTTRHIRSAMDDFVEFLDFIDNQLEDRRMTRIEDMLMPANFSSMVGEFIAARIPKYSNSVVRNRYHNGHPDLLPAGKYERDAAQHAQADGIEIKASRYLKSWQGHNAEDVWLLVFVFEGGRPTDIAKRIEPVRFRFLMVVGALLSRRDWLFAGRSKTSRRTITASVTKGGFNKMIKNWIYLSKELREGEADLVTRHTDK
jgi:hypothetical protein